MMRIAHVTASLSRLGGGVSEVVWAVATQQAARGAASAVFGLRDAYTRSDVPPANAVPYCAGGVLGPAALGYSPELRRQLRARAGWVDVVHAHGLWAHPSREARCLADRARVPRVVSPHGMLEPWALRRSAWKKRIAAWLYEERNLRSAACVHALCRAEARSVRAAGLHHPIAVIPNGVDLDAYDAERDAGSARRLWPEWRGARVVLFLGRIHPKKGLLHLVEAWHRLDRETAGWRLVIAGPDAHGHRAAVERVSTRLGLTSRVSFTGAVHGARKRALLARADVFALPSFSEGFSMAILEALASRLPVLMTPQCNFEEVAAVGAGVLAEPTADAVARGLRGLLALTDGQRGAMGQRGRDLVARDYVWPRVAQQMLATYAWLRGEAARPAWVLGGE